MTEREERGDSKRVNRDNREEIASAEQRRRTSTAGSGFKGWEGYTIFQSGDKERATGKLIKFLQAAWRKDKERGGGGGIREDERRSAANGPAYSARGNIVIKICTSLYPPFSFSCATPPPPLGLGCRVVP